LKPHTGSPHLLDIGQVARQFSGEFYILERETHEYVMNYTRHESADGGKAVWGTPSKSVIGGHAIWPT
jgi:hypothetical protein